MSAYYFTVSSLPAVSLFSSPLISRDEFILRCSMELDKGRLAFLEFLLNHALSAEELKTEIMPEMDIPAAYAEWNGFNKRLIREIALKRADRLGFDSTSYSEAEDSPYQIDDTVKKITSTESPLDAEKEIIRTQWEFLEEQETLHAFDFVQLIIYGIKLLLLERYALFTAEKGRDEFEEIFSNVQSRIKQINR